jgi:hypothetical protein
MFHVEQLEEGLLSGNAVWTGKPVIEGSHLLEDRVVGNCLDGRHWFEAQQGEPLVIPAISSLRGLGNDKEALNAKESSCALGGHRRGTKGTTDHKGELLSEVGLAG